MNHNLWWWKKGEDKGGNDYEQISWYGTILWWVWNLLSIVDENNDGDDDDDVDDVDGHDGDDGDDNDDDGDGHGFKAVGMMRV